MAALYLVYVCHCSHSFYKTSVKLIFIIKVIQFNLNCFSVPGNVYVGCNTSKDLPRGKKASNLQQHHYSNMTDAKQPQRQR